MQTLTLQTKQHTYPIKQLQSKHLAINQHYKFDATIEATKQTRFEKHQHAIIKLAEQRYHGVITHISNPIISQDKQHYEYRVKFESPLALLTDLHKRIFVDQSINDILRTLLRQITFKCTENSIIKSFMQYHETDFECFERLISENKLFYYFDEDTLRITKQIQPTQSNENFKRFEEQHITTRTTQITQVKTNHANAKLFECINDQLITSVSHFIKRDADTLSYYNTLSLQTHTDSLHKDVQQKPLPLQKASISQRNRTYYRVNYDWDVQQQRSQPIPLLQTGSQHKAGIHFPLQDHTHVCIAYLNNGATQPIIMGAESPHRTHTHHRLRNHHNNGILMNDAEEPETRITCTTQNNIKLNKHGIMFHAHSMYQHAESNLLQITNGHYTQQANTQTLHARNIKVYTQAGNINFKIGKQLTLHVHETLTIKSMQQHWEAKRMLFHSQQLHFNAASDLTCKTRQMKITLNKHAHIISQQGSCIIKNGASSICIEPSGMITVNAKTINVKSAQYCGFPPPPWL